MFTDGEERHRGAGKVMGIINMLVILRSRRKVGVGGVNTVNETIAIVEM